MRPPPSAPATLGRRLLAAAAVAALPFAGCAPPSGGERLELVVFAAASLREVVAAVEPEVESLSGRELVVSFAGSSVLASQLVAAPVADVFLSADVVEVDRLAAAGREIPGSRRELATNRLVVVGHPGGFAALDRLTDLVERPPRHLVLADPRAAPAGRHARAALEAAAVDGRDLWERLASRRVPVADVRAALAAVAATSGAAGIVYASDLASGPPVDSLYEIGPEEAPPIRYLGVAVDRGLSPAPALAFLDHLASPAGRSAFAAAGFGAPR